MSASCRIIGFRCAKRWGSGRLPPKQTQIEALGQRREGGFGQRPRRQLARDYFAGDKSGRVNLLQLEAYDFKAWLHKFAETNVACCRTIGEEFVIKALDGRFVNCAFFQPCTISLDVRPLMKTFVNRRSSVATCIFVAKSWRRATKNLQVRFSKRDTNNTIRGGVHLIYSSLRQFGKVNNSIAIRSKIN